MTSTRLTLLIVAVALLGAVAPAVALQAEPGLAAQTKPTATPAGANASTPVNVTPGAQLSTVLRATAVTTRGEIEDVRFERELERGTDDERAEALAEQAELLAERAAEIRADYEAATAARESGELTAEAYARELAALNARAESLLGDVVALRDHARAVSGLELEAAGFNRTALRAAAENLDPLTGVGPSAILQRFLGESTGEVELRTDTGLRIEVEGEDDEQSLEVTRQRDDNRSITAPQDAALQTARSALPSGDWTLLKASVHPDSGYYEFEFDLASATRTGEAEVRVDGSSGEVFRLEVETEQRDDDDRAEDGERDDRERDDEDDEREDRELALLLIGGQPAPNASITVRALADGEPAGNLTIAVNGVVAGETDAGGQATVQLPHASEVSITAGDAELEFEFDEAVHERDEVFRQLDVAASLDGGVVTVTSSFDGEPVTGASVYANDRRVGQTDADGTARFEIDPNATNELELELVKGEFEAEFEFDLTGEGLWLTEGAHEGDGDEVEDEADGPEDDQEGEEETDTPESEDDPEDDEETETPEGEDDQEDQEESETPEGEDDQEDEEESETPEEEDNDTDSSGSGSDDG